MTSGPQRDILTRLIWIYLWLWLLEGPIRKWLPAANTVFYLARDPVVVLAYWYAFKQGVLRLEPLIVGCFVVTVLLVVISLVNPDANLAISAFGIRTYVLHVPFMFVMGRHLTVETMCRMGKMFLLASIPMAVIVILQFVSSPGSWINTSAGGEGLTSQQSGVGDKIRPPGIFTYGAGLGSFLAIVLCFLALEIRAMRGRQLWLCVGAAAMCAIMYALSISRGAVLGAAITLGTIWSVGLAGKNANSLRLWSVVALGLMGVALLQVPVVQ